MIFNVHKKLDGDSRKYVTSFLTSLYKFNHLFISGIEFSLEIYTSMSVCCGRFLFFNNSKSDDSWFYSNTNEMVSTRSCPYYWNSEVINWIQNSSWTCVRADPFVEISHLKEISYPNGSKMHLGCNTKTARLPMAKNSCSICFLNN